MFRSLAQRRRYVLTAQVMALVLLVATAVWWVFLQPQGIRFTARFASAVGVYPESDVRVLGVRVGRVLSVVPERDSVRVEVELDHGVDVPADVRAAVVAPSVVADRYLQLAPAHTGGDRLVAGAVVPLERTAASVELDQLYGSLERLLDALGPDGANREGALSDLLGTGAAALDGNGAKLGEAVRELASATRVLSGSRDDLFGAVDHLKTFTGALASVDEQVGLLAGQLSDVAGFFAAERGDLEALLGELAAALEAVRGFVGDNRGRLKSTVDDLAELTGVLAAQRGSLDEAIRSAPRALHNVIDAYDPRTGRLTVRANLNEFVSDLLSVPGGPR
ncbi:MULTISPECIES: MCE family protein [Actinosynnema]|uniref:MCE family protein n=1 Tax=Actinosynnema TaxID=40566 RepID=UPI0020A53859|nr:MCE family protein [Actinosynnema pretiosum]MCP2097123.1 virulence factor Mce family protein [Actinosynnema pretiosum]